MKQQLRILGMHCTNCANTIAKLLQNEPGIQKLQIDAEKNLAEVEFDPALTSMKKWNESLGDFGYSFIQP